MGVMKNIDIDTREELEREMDVQNINPSERPEYIESNYSRVSIQKMVEYGRRSEIIKH